MPGNAGKSDAVTQMLTRIRTAEIQIPLETSMTRPAFQCYSTIFNMQSHESRRVANLTTDQVSKKRALDRSNQRSHRAKNKAYIQHLEAKVAELTYNLERAEARLAEYEKQQSEKLTETPVCPTQNDPGSSTLADPAFLDLEGYDSSRLGSNLKESHQAQEGSFDVIQSLDTLPLDFGAGIEVNFFDSPQEFTFSNLGLPDLSSANGTGLSQSSVIQESLEGSSSFGSSSSNSLGTPEWQQIPMNIPPTNKLDELIISKARSWRDHFLRSGHQNTELGEPRFPSISSLLNRPFNEDEDIPRPVSDVVAAQVLRSPIKSLVERIGFMYKLAYFVRWLVCQTEETYKMIPEFLRPTHLQRTVPHPAWIDVVTYPDARDELIRQMNWDVYESFRALTGSSVSVTWPFPDSGAFMESADGRCLRLNPLFESHIRNRGNWKCGKEVGDAFPFMRPYCRP